MHYRRVLRNGTTDRLVEPGLKVCSVDGCEQVADARGLCHGHYQRVLRTGSVKEGEPLSRTKNPGICIVDGCDRPQRTKQMCKGHYSRLLRLGDVSSDVPLKPRNGSGSKSHGYWKVPVPKEFRHLTNGQTPVAEHRLVMAIELGRPLTSDESVHHRNGDRLDNRIENLELWSASQPKGQRLRDKIEHARELLERYGDDPTTGTSDDPVA
jgi:hypothetical protein